MKKTLCLGCVGGEQYHQHVYAADVNLDLKNMAGYRNLVVHDLNQFPYPFKDDEFGLVFSSHTLEHLNDPQKALYEMLRIGLVVEIYVPHRYSKYAKHADHKAFFSTTWFKKVLTTLPVNYTLEVIWGFPLSLRPREIHVKILKKRLKHNEILVSR